MLRYEIKSDLLSIPLEDWNNLLSDSITATVFQTPEYCQAWWNVFVHDDKQLCLVVIYDEKEIIGIAPLRRQNDKITFLGTDSVGKGQDLVTDFGDIVAKKGREKEIWKQVVGAIREMRVVREVVLDYVRESSQSFSVLKESGHQISEMIDNANSDVAPYLFLPKTWDEYLAQLGRKERHELRRKLRRLEGVGYEIDSFPIGQLNYSYRHSEVVKEFIRLHKLSTREKDLFMTSLMETFFTKLSEVFTPQGLLEFSFLKIGGENVASTISFLWKNEFWLYNSGFDRKYDNLAIGFLLKALTIKMAIEKGFARYSFLRGNERYKYDLGAKDEKLYKIIIKP